VHVPVLDYTLRDRATRAAGMAFEKHFVRIDPRPRRPEESYPQTRAALTRLLASAPIVPPIRVAIVHDPLSDAPGSGGGTIRLADAQPMWSVAPSPPRADSRRWRSICRRQI